MVKTTLERLNECLNNTKTKNKEINAILEIRKEEELIDEAKKIDEKISKNKVGVLAGKIIALSSNICMTGLKPNCASKVLEDFTSPYNATVVEKILNEDGLIIGYCNQDEFSCGASAVATGFCDIVISSDAEGQIRTSASVCGLAGIKPTYGAVSRYGLIDSSASMEQIGPITKNTNDAELILKVIVGKDKKDAITQEIKKEKGEIKKVGILDFEIKNKEISKIIEEKTKEVCEKNKWEIKKIKIPSLNLAVEAYYILAYIDFFSGTRKFDGRRFGKKIEEFAEPEALRRIFGGAEITKTKYEGKYLEKALQVKEKIKEEFQKAFQEVDCIISPIALDLPRENEKKLSLEKKYALNILTIPANISEICAGVVKVGEVEKNPIGIQIMCNKFEEKKLIELMKKFE